MKTICSGFDANRRSIKLTPEMRRETHFHILGGSGTGKSGLLEHLTRQDIRAGHGLCVIDRHGTLFENILKWCASLEIGVDGDHRELIVIDATRDHEGYVKPLDLFP